MSVKARNVLGGKLVFNIFAALAEFERGVILARTMAGLQAARARGSPGGRPPALKANDLAAAKALLRDPEITVLEVARRLGVAASTLYRHLPRARTAALEAGAALLLPDRLAADQPLGPFRPRPRPLPALWPPAWCHRPASGRWPVVGRGAADLAGRQRSQGPLAYPGCAAPDDEGRAGGCPSRPRPGPLWAAAPQRQGPLPTMSSAV